MPSKKYSWKDVQDDLAQKNGLAIILVDENSPDLVKSNNNSMCEVLYNSEEFAPDCDRYCGAAFGRATDAGKAVEYQCYAGLNCRAVPLKTETKPLVAITGRVFLKAEDYRAATERAVSGDWQKFPPQKFFDNILLSSSPKDLQALANRLEKLSANEKAALAEFAGETRTIDEKTGEVETKKGETAETDELTALIEQFHKTTTETSIVSEKINQRNNQEPEDLAEWRSLFGRLLNLSYEKAYKSILRFLASHYSIINLAWLERTENRLETIFAVGDLQSRQLQIGIAADDKRLLEAAQRAISLELQEKQTSETENSRAQTVNLFPVAIGGEIQNALLVGDEIADRNVKKRIARFCYSVASQLEILRLREKLSRRGWLEHALRRFNENLKNIDSDDFWTSLVQISAELMRAERCSLLLFDEKSKTFVVKAATGARADAIKQESAGIGERAAKNVFQEGKAIVVADVNKIEVGAASPESGYKTDSFIICPIKVGDRKIGVLNVTDHADRKIYKESDLELLNAIVPQLGVLIDRVTLKDKAGELEHLSVTDHLTGLLNKRYLKERLAEEIKRSNRYGYPMSFMMIDVDYFKSYNDSFGHPEGDKALEIVAQCLRETLRGADIAARFGGEEFSILLPQTTPDEALIIGERVREKVEKTEFPHRQVTVSVGIASCSHIIGTPDAIIKAADKALYNAKAKGRNNVQGYD